MDCRSQTKLLLSVGYCVFICFVVGFRPLVIGGFLKLVASLALVCLLMFVVNHSANVCRAFVACLRALSVPSVMLAAGRRCTEQSSPAFVVPNQPSLSPLFQRPPPILGF
jgi:hypothetical protein